MCHLFGHFTPSYFPLGFGELDQEINENVHKLTINKNADDWSIGLFKLAMINFDQRLFTKTFNDLLEQFSFSEVFKNVFVPLMNELGVLWQTNSISPSHEHFITSLVKQKIHAMCEDLHELSLSIFLSEEMIAPR